jgi:uncharacterized protein (TIGR03435 family)
MTRLAVLLCAASALFGQSGDSPKWKEFSIGPPTSNQTGFGPNGLRAQGIPLVRALSRAYGLPEHRIIGPDWLDTERYAIVAQVDDLKDFQPLFQQELTARFKMVAHRETKEVLIYVIKPLDGAPPPTQSHGNAPRGTMGFSVSGSTVAGFASTLADLVKRPVFDETGMDGKFDLSLYWKPNDWASLEAAAKEQLGLQLVPSRRSVELLIIEHIERLQFSK